MFICFIYLDAQDRNLPDVDKYISLFYAYSKNDKKKPWLRDPTSFLSTVSLYDTIVVSSFKNKFAECTEKFILV